MKKLDQIVEAVGILKQKGENYNIAFVGDGEIRQSLEVEVAKYQLQDNVWFYGPCFDEKINAELIYNADLCVAPGNIGLTAMHVLMFGCPAISHNNFKCQMPEFESIIPGHTGAFSSTTMWKILLVVSLSGLYQRAVVEKKSVKLAIKRLMIVGILIIS